MKTMVAGGGGIDSTFGIYELLTQTTDEVTVLFCDLSAVQYADPNAKPDFWKASAAAERIAMGNVAAWLAANTRPFTLTIVDVASTNESRAPTVIREAALRAAAFDRFWFCRSPEQMGPAKNSRHYFKVWRSNRTRPIPMEWPLVDRDWGRPHCINRLPQALRALTLSCHNPSIVAGVPTRDGTCAKCLITDKTIEMLAAGTTEDAVLDWILRTVGAEPYTDGSFADPRYQSGRMRDGFGFMRSPVIAHNDPLANLPWPGGKGR